MFTPPSSARQLMIRSDDSSSSASNRLLHKPDPSNRPLITQRGLQIVDLPPGPV